VSTDASEFGEFFERFDELPPVEKERLLDELTRRKTASAGARAEASRPHRRHGTAQEGSRVLASK